MQDQDARRAIRTLIEPYIDDLTTALNKMRAGGASDEEIDSYVDTTVRQYLKQLESVFAREFLDSCIAEVTQAIRENSNRHSA